MLYFEDYTFGYEERRWKISHMFHGGDVWLLLGGNASGKTTIVKAIAGQFSAAVGVAQYRSQPLLDLSAESMRAAFFFVPQEPQWTFFGDTFSDHLLWIGKRLGKADGLSTSVGSLPPSISQLLSRNMVDLRPEELAILAIAEDDVFPRDILILDECPDFEVLEYSSYLLNQIRRRQENGRITIITRHIPAPWMPPHLLTGTLNAEDFRSR